MLCENKNLIILTCDKNLGPAIIERRKYVKLVLNEHLLNSSNYRRLDPHESDSILCSLKEELLKLIKDYELSLSEGELNYFDKKVKVDSCVP